MKAFYLQEEKRKWNSKEFKMAAKNDQCCALCQSPKRETQEDHWRTLSVRITADLYSGMIKNKINK